MVQRVELYSTTSIPANTLIRLITALVGISLLAASAVLLIEAQEHPRPSFQAPAALVTLALGIAVFYGGALAARGRRHAALALFATCALLLTLMPILQLLPIRYDNVFLLDLKASSPPLWPYTVAIPLLFFLLFEMTLPTVRSSNVSGLFVVSGVLAAVMILFFSTTLIGVVGNYSVLILLPQRLFLTSMAPIGISGLIVLGTVLPRKGMVMEGMGLLLFIGLGIEWISIWSYQGPHFLPEGIYALYPKFPLLPVLGGTIPGALTALTGILAGWEAYVRGANAFGQ